MHAVVMGKFFEDSKTSELALLINSCLYVTSKYVKVNSMRAYNCMFLTFNDSFSHITLSISNKNFYLAG